MTNPSNILVDGTKFGAPWLQIYWYGALIVVGIILSYVLCSIEAKRRDFHKDCVIDLCLICVPLGAVFARLYYVAFSAKDFFQSGMSFSQILLGIIDVREGGLAMYGAIIGGVLGMAIYSRVKKMRMLSILDMIMPSVALAQAIGRWGNFFNQEAYGRVISEGFPPYFPLAVKIDACDEACCTAPNNLNNIHYATFFYESCWCLIIFAVLWFIIRKLAKHRGDVTLVYFIMYGAERALVEGLRTDSLMWGRFRVSQVLSVALVAVSVILIIIRTVLEKKKGRILMPVEDVYYGKKPGEEKDKEGSEEEKEEEKTESAEEEREEEKPGSKEEEQEEKEPGSEEEQEEEKPGSEE